MASNGGAALAVSLVEAAVRAAVLSGAPRRTVAAAAAAVASAMVAGRGSDGARAGASEPSAVSERRRKKNRRKKERRKEARAGDPELAHDAQPVEDGTCSRLDVGEHPVLGTDVSLATAAPPPPPEPAPGTDATMREEGDPSLMAAPMALSPANLAVFEGQQNGHQPREIEFDDISQRHSMDSQAVRHLLGIEASSAGTPVPGDDDL